jgi:iron(III) transport system permease protein
LSLESQEFRGTTSAGAAARAAAPVSRFAGIFSPENVSKVGSLVLLSALAVLPIVVYISSSFRIYTEAGPVGFTFSNYVRTFTQPQMVESIWNTLIIAVGTAFFSSIVGVSLAWFHARTDMPMRKILEPLTLIPFFLSSFLGAIAWWTLAAPRTGMLNRWMIDLFGLSGPPFNIYSMTGMIMVLAIFYVPYMYLFTIGSMNRMDPALEESARVCGTGVLRTALRVTIPLSTPAILSGAIIIFVVSAGVFGVPTLLGPIARISTLSTVIYVKMQEYPLDIGGAAAAGSILMLITVVGLYFQRKIVAPRSYVTVTGKGYRPSRVSLGHWKYAAMALNLFYIIMAVILPLGALLLASLNRAWLGGFRWSQLSLYNWNFILFSYDYAMNAVKNSLILGLVGGFMTVILCTFLAMVILRGRSKKLSGAVDYLATLPIGVPGLVMGMAFLITWIRTPLYGFPLFLLMLAYMTRYLPYGLRTISSVLQSLSPELEESSRVCGSTFLRTIRKVTVPLLRPGIFAAYLMLFIMFIRELPVSALLATEASTPMAVALYVISENEQLGVTAAFALVQAILLLLGTVIFRRLGNIERLSV